MSIIQGICDSFRTQLLAAQHNFLSDQIMLALYTDSANINQSTTIYTPSGEATGTGYTAGGKQLQNVQIAFIPGVAWVQWNNIAWTGLPSTFMVRGALMYNASNQNSSIMVLDFGSLRFPDQFGNLTITFPIYPAIDAPLRLA